MKQILNWVVIPGNYFECSPIWLAEPSSPHSNSQPPEMAVLYRIMRLNMLPPPPGFYIQQASSTTIQPAWAAAMWHITTDDQSSSQHQLTLLSPPGHLALSRFPEERVLAQDMDAREPFSPGMPLQWP